MPNRRPHRRNDPNCNCNEDLKDAYGYDWREFVPGTGWLYNYVDYALATTDAPPIYHVASGLSCLSAVVSANCDFKIDKNSKPLPLNMWILVAGTSSVQRKSTAVSLVSEALSENFPMLMIP